eukprot:s10129_g1.t1
MGVISFLKEGVRLVGTSECPECFEYKLVPAPLTESELFETAAERRTALLSKDERVSADESRILKEATDSEVALGFLEGPFYEHSEVSAKLGTEAWTVIRRFVLIQGAEQKPRPIDNCLEAQLNAGFSSSIHLRLQDSDYISAMALHVAGEIKEGRAHASAQLNAGFSSSIHLRLQDSDYISAMALHVAGEIKEGRAHASARTWKGKQEDGRDALYLSNSLMFGSTAAVYSFNRVSRALWFLINRLLWIPAGVYYDDFPLMCPASTAAVYSFNRVSRALWFLINRLLWIPAGVYYDDFPLMCPAASSENADECVSSFLDALGWLHAKTGVAGIGLAAHDCFCGAGWVYEGLVPADLLEHWKAEVGDQLICEIELFAILASMLELTSILQSRRIVWWVDNDAARSVLIKGASKSWAMHSLARIFTEIDREFPSMWWVCRVPSFSNPGDAPSRGHGSESVTMVGASKVHPRCKRSVSLES